jgi:NAD+ synthase (glutamine-hydrolysing)
MRCRRCRNARDGRDSREHADAAAVRRAEADQTDQDSLPPYDVLDDILRQYVEEDRSIAEIAREGTRRGARAPRGAHGGPGRVQAPPEPAGIKITPRAFGKDRRLPITNRWRG